MHQEELYRRDMSNEWQQGVYWNCRCLGLRWSWWLFVVSFVVAFAFVVAFTPHLFGHPLGFLVLVTHHLHFHKENGSQNLQQQCVCNQFSYWEHKLCMFLLRHFFKCLIQVWSFFTCWTILKHPTRGGNLESTHVHIFPTTEFPQELSTRSNSNSSSRLGTLRSRFYLAVPCTHYISHSTWMKSIDWSLHYEAPDQQNRKNLRRKKKNNKSIFLLHCKAWDQQQPPAKRI